MIGTVVANAVMTALQLHRLRIGFNGRFEGGQTTMITARIAVASVLLAGVSWVAWYALNAVLGESLPAQIVAMAAAAGAGVWIYTRAVLTMHIPEAHQVRSPDPRTSGGAGRAGPAMQESHERLRYTKIASHKRPRRTRDCATQETACNNSYTQSPSHTCI